MANDKPNVLMYFEWRHALKALPDATRLRVYEAIMDYAETDIEPDFSDDPAAGAVFNLMRGQVDRDKAKYAAQKANGSKGGRPRKSVSPASDGTTRSEPIEANDNPAKPNETQKKANVDVDADVDAEVSVDTPQPPAGTAADAADVPAQDSQAASAKKRPILPAKDRERFDRWYASYPRKVGKDAALRAWAKLRPDDELTDSMIRAVAEQKAKDHRFREMQYIPHPASWLNHGEWQNEYDSGEQPRAQPAAPYTDWTQDPDYNRAMGISPGEDP